MMSWMLPLALAAIVFAHDEGHGPKLSDMPKQGGVLAPVIDAKEANKGAKATLVYKAELLRSEDGAVRVYLYDKDMKPLDLSKLNNKAKGIVEVFKKGKATKTSFELTLKDGAFVGTPAKPAKKPYNIDITLTERTFLAAFDNLD